MSEQVRRCVVGAVLCVAVVCSDASASASAAERTREKLGRGVVALNAGDGKVYVGWRMTADDPKDVAFNVYRSSGGGEPVKLNEQPVTDSTNFVDAKADLKTGNAYSVRPVVNGQEQTASAAYTLAANTPARNYIPIKLQGNYVFNRMGVADLDCDGEYDYVIKQPDQVSDPGKFQPSQDTWKLEAYKSDGTFLWRRDLGWNIEQGVWWSPFVVHDLDGDGKAEVVAKTAPMEPDYRKPNVRGQQGRVNEGPEWFSVFDGTTGEERARADWIARGDLSQWGDNYGNRSSRNLMGVAFLDGKLPSILVFRGTYMLMKGEAWDFRDGKLAQRWTWSNQGLGPEYQGFHNLRIADIDQDGRDEIFNGSIVMDDDGRMIYATRQGHGDRFHLTDIDPDRPGWEVWYAQEEPKKYEHGSHLREAATGKLIFGQKTTADVGRALVADIDPRHKGLECWAVGGGAQYLYNCKGDVLGDKLPPCQFAVWWDDDLLRELVEDGKIYKWDHENNEAREIGRHEVYRYSEKMVADVIGDWREEIITVADGELRVYTTTIPSTRRFPTLMLDPIYRTDVALMSMGYVQSAHPSFYLGEGMKTAD